MEFRPRNYSAEEEAHALPRSRADDHPLSTSPSPPPNRQDTIVIQRSDDFFDPLGGLDDNAVLSIEGTQENECTSAVWSFGDAGRQDPAKEWIFFKRSLTQRFPLSKTVSISSMSDGIMRSGKTIHKKSSMHLEELDDPQKFAEEGVKVITGQEYVSRLHELKDEINRAWHAEDRVTALKLSIKVAKLLMDTSVLQFYPTLFILATDVMDMLGDLVWERIKQKAETAEDGTVLCSLPENFEENDICFDAKETCNNWFCKVGSIRELLPRIYLELAILPCWRFLLVQPAETLQRLVMMTRGLADPLASAYCRLYIAHCAQKLPSSSHDAGYLITCINDVKVMFMRILSEKETTQGIDNRKLLINLVEPTIEYIMKCNFKDASQRLIGSALLELGLGKNQVELCGSSSCVSIVLHHLLKELPTEVVGSNALEIVHLIECSNDNSFDQCLNYRLLGFRLSESRLPVEITNAVVERVIQVVSRYNKRDDYLKVMDAYVDIVLHNQMENYLNVILEGISKRVYDKEAAEDELGMLQSILVKLLSHFKDLEDVFALNHFLEILDVMYGSSRDLVSMQILIKATRNGFVRNPTTIQLLFEICQVLHDGKDFGTLGDDDNQQTARQISRFIHMVDYGAEIDRHFTFLVECRGAFGSINELKETLVHSSNFLATRALKDGKKQLSFVKSCLAFSEVTIPSVSTVARQLNLYLETAEVALLGGLVSHSDGLIDSAINCLQSPNLLDGSRTLTDAGEIPAAIQKLCSLLVMLPGNHEVGVTYIPRSLASLINSQSWMTPRTKARMFCALILLLGTLSQNKLPYHVDCSEILGNDVLFYGDPSYVQDLVSLSEFIVQSLLEVIEQEPAQAARGRMALEACNCIASSFKVSSDVELVCSKLMETAKSGLSSNNKYLESSIRFLNKQLPKTSGIPVAG